MASVLKTIQQAQALTIPLEQLTNRKTMKAIYIILNFLIANSKQ